LDAQTVYRGIILAGGTGSRLFPITYSVSKQLLPVYDKPMIYYPLSTLMLAGIKEILIITTPEDNIAFKKLLGNGNQWGIKIDYMIQTKPEGIAQAFLLAEDYLSGMPACLILGDNIFYAEGLSKKLQNATKQIKGATIFGYYVNDPDRYGVVKFDRMNKTVIDIVEKPRNPPSNFAIPGLYFYDAKVCNYAKRLKPSPRGELEITDLNKMYLSEGQLKLEIMSRGTAWLDTGTCTSLLDAAQFVKVVEDRQGLKIACPEEIAWRMGYINSAMFIKSIKRMKTNEYSTYLLKLIEREEL
jgi:glucose-1-phosphate thymidylyltransferase